MPSPEQTAKLNRDLPTADRRRLDQYLHGRARDRATDADRQSASRRTFGRPQKPVGIPDDFEEHLKTMFDLQVLAWQAGMTRISTLMLALEASNAVYLKKRHPGCVPPAVSSFEHPENKSNT